MHKYGDLQLFQYKQSEETDMRIYENESFDQERSFYGQSDLLIRNCAFRGPADGESALKECRDIQVDYCEFDLRYPFWHDEDIQISNSSLSESCRAALWYTGDLQIRSSRLNGIKALRECHDVQIEDCSINSAEFGWSTAGIMMTNTDVISEYFMMRSDHLVFDHVSLNGKYSFQYIHDGVFDHCNFDTKDAFWHSKNVIVRNSTIKGEYLAWYSENLTLENCAIIGTQPLCYCKNLKLINCRMIDTDLSFERSEVRATLTEPIESIKNPMSGTITVPYARQVIFDLNGANGRVIQTDAEHAFPVDEQ